VNPSALDLFCGGGGVSVGLERAGFDVVGVDVFPQAEYPKRFDFIQSDALAFLRFVDVSRFDLIWASPPCQSYSHATRDGADRPRLIGDVRIELERLRKPYVIENVAGAFGDLRGFETQCALFEDLDLPRRARPLMLCGAMFDLGVVRHRYFETNFPIRQPKHAAHDGSIVTGEYVTVAGKGGVPAWTLRKREELGLPLHFEGDSSLPRWREAMGIDWLSMTPLVQAIPPAYSEFIGREFLARRRR